MSLRRSVWKRRVRFERVLSDRHRLTCAPSTYASRNRPSGPPEHLLVDVSKRRQCRRRVADEQGAPLEGVRRSLAAARSAWKRRRRLRLSQAGNASAENLAWLRDRGPALDPGQRRRKPAPGASDGLWASAVVVEARLARVLDAAEAKPAWAGSAAVVSAFPGKNGSVGASGQILRRQELRRLHRG